MFAQALLLFCATLLARSWPTQPIERSYTPSMYGTGWCPPSASSTTRHSVETPVLRIKLITLSPGSTETGFKCNPYIYAQQKPEPFICLPYAFPNIQPGTDDYFVAIYMSVVPTSFPDMDPTAFHTCCEVQFEQRVIASWSEHRIQDQGCTMTVRCGGRPNYPAICTQVYPRAFIQSCERVQCAYSPTQMRRVGDR